VRDYLRFQFLLIFFRKTVIDW